MLSSYRFYLRSDRTLYAVSSYSRNCKSLVHFSHREVRPRKVITMPPKRKRSSIAQPGSTNGLHGTPLLPPRSPIKPPPPKKRASRRGPVDTNPDNNADIVDGKVSLRASPDADENGEYLDTQKVNGTQHPKGTKGHAPEDSPLCELETPVLTPASKKLKTPTKSSIAAKKGTDEIKAFKAEQAAKKAIGTKVKEEDDDEWDKRQDPDGDDEGPVEDVDVLKKEAGRPPPVNSSYLPIPWQGRLGYACLNTYLRFSNPPIFTSRTCRIASILEHRHPLRDPTQPEHTTKNRPDKAKPALVERGQRYVEELSLANIRDLPKMLRWNEKYGIRFMRLSSEMFPFASHLEYGYKLAPFAAEALAEVGKVATELGHRLSTHPGQFTQLGSPRPGVIANAIRDLEYHNEMLSLLKQPAQQDRDTVMILHMGGTFGDKAATIDRFRENYMNLSPSIKMRLVLENDDVSWSVHDLLPVCEELNIPLCLDFHHHNIIFDSDKLREGTHDIRAMFPRIKATWDRKGIRQKMHYSEPCPEAITGRQRRKHNPRPVTLPPCANDMDLMIEAKDKEQAVFELMRTLKLPGWNTFNNIIPYERDDDNKPLPKKAKKKKTKRQIAAEVEEFGKEVSEEETIVKEQIPEAEVGMGGKNNRVYWPPGMEEWLRPKKREQKKKDGAQAGDEAEMFENPTPANFAARKAITERNSKMLDEGVRRKLASATNLGELHKIMDEIKAGSAAAVKDEDEVKKMPAKKRVTKKSPAKSKVVKEELVDGYEDEDEDMEEMHDFSAEDELADTKVEAIKAAVVPQRASGRSRGKRKSYVEDEGEDEE